MKVQLTLKVVDRLFMHFNLNLMDTIQSNVKLFKAITVRRQTVGHFLN